MSNFADDLTTSLQQALDHARGKKIGVREHVIEVPDVRAIREGLHLSQTEFASTYHIPLATLKGWEQGRRQPDSTAAAYLNVIAKIPAAARDALAPQGA
ncbi:COG2944 Predicted transcriptional regulator [Caulobacteraceae bacterium]|jgi:putative transcriptional regulator